jgi:hypothetical protein
MNERMNENRKEIYLNQEFYVAEYLDMDKGNYVKTKYTKIEQWSFYLRFISEWFTPCKKDQLKLKEILLNTQLRVDIDTATVGFNQMLNKEETKMIYSFTLPFVHSLPHYEFTPCADCQKVIAQTMLNSESLTIGNKDYEHPVELSRKNADQDDFQTIIDRPPTAEEKKRVGDGWIKHRLSKEEWEKLLVID